MAIPPPRPREAFAHCMRLATSHYENFPVASLLLPRRMRHYVAAVYAFARTADDFADELPLPAEERLRRLDEWDQKLNECTSGAATDPVFVALGETIRNTGIPKNLLADLLTAYRMDVSGQRFHRFEDLLQYCRFSANPVGRLVLHLFGEADERKSLLSDDICTGLQLANFWQDVGLDRARGRIYLPLEDLARFGYTPEELDRERPDDRFRSLLAHEVDRAEGFLRRGGPLARLVRSRRLRLELSLTVRGGLAVLRAIRRSRYDVLRARPLLSKSEKASVFISAVFGRGL